MPRKLPALSRLLLAWFSRHARPLPWRRASDPFAIWISEVMLQQTQAATVVPYFERFLQAYPDVRALALAEEADVLRLWEGLGYYRRARALHQAARQLLAEHDGIIPNDPSVVGRLPGLGRYTTNAILSQAFDRRVPILEANSRRVLCRLLGIDRDPRQAEVDRQLWQAAEELLPKRQGAGRCNQALMEVGALLCTPRRPACEECPLRDHCVARRLGRQEDMPPRPPPPVIEEVDEVAVVLRRAGDVLFLQRPTTGRWANMWEFPHAPLADNETHAQAAGRLLASIGFTADIQAEMLTIRHAVTRFRITLTCLEAQHCRGEFRSPFFQQATWVGPHELGRYPVSSPQRKLARKAMSD